MPIVNLSMQNLEAATQLTLKLWPECNDREEYDHYRGMLDSDRETAFLYQDDDGRYVGFIVLSLRYDHVEGTDSSPVGYLEGIYVEPRYRETGIGRQLVEAGMDWSRRKGCREMASDAELPNLGSQHFHRRLGFAEVNRIVCYRMDL